MLQRHSGIEHLDLGQIQLDLGRGSRLLGGISAQTRSVLQPAQKSSYKLAHTSLGCLRVVIFLCKTLRHFALHLNHCPRTQPRPSWQVRMQRFTAEVPHLSNKATTGDCSSASHGSLCPWR